MKRYVTRRKMFKNQMKNVQIFYKNARFYSDLPTPKGLSIFGTKFDLWRAGASKNLHEYIDKKHKELGPIFQENLGPVNGIFISDLKAIRDVFLLEGKYPMHIIPKPWIDFNKKQEISRGLLFMDGPEWWKNRQIMNKIFLKNDVKWIENCCDLIINKFVDKLTENCPNLEHELYKTFLEILVCILVGENYEQNRKTVEPLVENLANNVKNVFSATSKLMLLPEWTSKLKLPQWKNFENSMLISFNTACDLVDILNNKCENHNGLLRRMVEYNIDENQRKAIVSDLVLAAADTTSYTMQWMLFLVAQNTEIQEKIRDNSNPLYLRYLTKETLRLYPVAPFITRFIPKKIKLLNYEIQENSLIIMSIYTLGRDEKYFENPHSFNPERWERVIGKRLGTNFPFAIGVRSCIGKKLAEYELEMCLKEIIKKFTIKVENPNVKMILKMISVPSEPIKFKLKEV